MILSKIFDKGWQGHILALIAGGALAFAYAPYNYFILPFFSITLLLGLWLNVDKRCAFWRGFCFGLGLFGLGVSWVYVSIHIYGETPSWLSAFITFGFVCILALFPAFTGYLLTRFFSFNNNTKLLCAFPALWMLLEWSRSWLFTGFPWLELGYTQMNTPLRNLAPYAGVYGISFAIVLACAFIVYGILGNKKRRYRCAIAFAIIWIIAGLASFASWTKPTQPPMTVSLIQGNVAQHMKWDPDEFNKTLRLYRSLTQKHWNSRIIVWPEAAVPMLKKNVKDYLDELDTTAKKHQSSVILGIPTQGLGHDEYHNSLIVLGTGYGTYHKRHLVPFGEYVPERKYLSPLLDAINFPVYDIQPGSYHQILPDASGVIIAPFICYETAFPELVRNFFGKANLIVAVSDDSWFGHSWAVDQHLQMTQMRALETGRYALFANNSGSSAIINEKGYIIARAKDDTRMVLTGQIQPMAGKTPWLLLGMNLLLLAFIIMLVIAGRTQYLLSH